MQLSFGQKLLVAVGVLIVVIMSVFTFTADQRLQNTTETYVTAMLDDAVKQSTASIADWLNTRLDMTEAVASSLRNIRTDNMARNLLDGMRMRHIRRLVPTVAPGIEVDVGIH